MGDTRRISKTGKSKKLGNMKKKKQVVAADLSSDGGEENAEVEVHQMSSGDEDYSKGMENETLEISGGKKMSKRSKDEKRKKGDMTRRKTQEFDTQSEQAEDKLQKLKKKKRENVENINKVSEFNKKDDASEQQIDEQKSKKKKRKNVENVNKVDEFNEKDDASEQQIGKSKKPRKMKKKQLAATDVSSDNLLEKRGDDAEYEVYEMSSGDEDNSKGMKKWITEYHQSRPGLNVLQERIDDFIVAHEEKEEQAKAEREARAAEGGWTVVVHHRGRKKTTEAETGVAVGSVNQAAVLDNMGKKKKKEVGLDFYRHQKKEAHRNEIMMLQSKFEQDKKRIQQMRAARKFRPY